MYSAQRVSGLCLADSSRECSDWAVLKGACLPGGLGAH